MNKRFLCGLLLSACVAVQAQEPGLPAGLGEGPGKGPGEEEPALPIGVANEEPALPAGGADDEPELPLGSTGAEPPLPGSNSNASWSPDDSPSLSEQLGISGFWEVRAGLRTRDPVEQRDTSLAETRLELEKDIQWSSLSGKLVVDALYDDVAESRDIDLESGEGWLDLREGWLQHRLGNHADVKLGRQILTWGVGDLLFINDLFPKDWNSFLAGRDEQYLKAPSDALRIGAYSPAVNINLIYTPRFDSDRYIDGQRLSYFNAALGDVAGRNAVVAVDKPDQTGDDDEIALRLYRQLASFEVALYGYSGYWKSPAGFDPVSGRATFPALRVYGASARGPLGAGIVSSEIGYYDSRDDQRGDNPLVNNSEWRALLAYEWEVANDTTLGLQYYLEALQDYDAYRDSLTPGQPKRDHYRQLVTARLTHLALNQNFTMSLFAFYSPTDRDAYLRPKIAYKATDNWLVEGGFNLFAGQHNDSFFGQFESNSNGYLALRYSF